MGASSTRSWDQTWLGCSARSRRQEPPASQSRPRWGCLRGTSSPSRRHRQRRCRSLHPLVVDHPARGRAQQLGDLAVAVAAVPPSGLDEVGGEPVRSGAPHRRPGPAGVCAASSGAARALGARGARRPGACLGRRACSMRTRRRAGLGDSRDGLLQDQLVQREVGHRPAQPRVLGFQLLRTPDLLGLEPTELLPPAVIGHLGDADRTNGVGHAPALRGQDVHLAQLGDDLLGLASLARPRGPPCCPKTYLRMDHSRGGGSKSCAAWN